MLYNIGKIKGGKKMSRYAIYRTIEINGKFCESLMCIAYSEEDAHEIVQAFRKQMGNQMYHFKKLS